MSHSLSPDQQFSFFEEMRKTENEVKELVKKAGLLSQKGQLTEGNESLNNSLLMLETHYNKWRLFLEELPEYWDLRYRVTKSEILYSMGSNFYISNDFEKSKDKFQEALLLLGDDHSAHKAYLLRFLAGSYSSTKSFQEASACFQKAFDEFLAVGKSYQIQGAQELADNMVIEAGKTLAFSASIFLSQELRSDYIKRLEETIQFAKRNGLTELSGSILINKLKFQMDNDPTGQSLQEYADIDKIKELRSLAKIPIFELNALMLLAEISRKKGDLRDAEKQLLKAKSASQNQPDRRWNVLLALADISETIGKREEAIKILQEAENFGRQENNPDVSRVVYTNLIPLLLESDDPAKKQDAEKRISELKKQGETVSIIPILLNRALLFSMGGKHDLAMDDLELASQYAETWDDKIKVLQGKIITLSKMGNKEKALALSRCELAAFMDSISIEIGENIVEWKALLGSIETLYMNAAFIAAELGRLPEAWEWAENGRVIRLRFQLNKRYPGSFSGNQWMNVSYEEALDFLRMDNSALAIYSIFKHRILVLVIDPNTGISHKIIDDFGGIDLERLIPEEKKTDMNQWNKCISHAVSQIPSDLVAPLKRITTNNIYISPDSLLYALPFYAIGFGDGTCVIDRYCTSIIPSFSILKLLRSRKKVPFESCLALGSGKENEFNFIEQASKVSDLAWKSSILLPDPEDLRPIKEQLLSQIESVRVVHIVCHGSTSELELDKASNAKLDSRDIANLRDLSTDLVFLNACVSGSYPIVLPSEIGGFWEAFLLAGVRTVISTLSYVNPTDAHKIAMSFYESWLKGMNKAEALRTAQLSLKNGGMTNWATHVILGDIN